MRNLFRLIYVRLILPFQQTDAPIAEVSRGALVGMFVALTPTVGVQMYIAATLWVIARYLLRIRFNLPIAIALVWITNPLTVVPVYYAYLLTGNWALRVFTHALPVLSYSEFANALEGARNEGDLFWATRLYQGALALFWQFGWPIVVGSLFWAIPLSLLSYPATAFLLRWYRKLQARAEGLSYEEWNRKHIRRPPNSAL